MKLFTVSLLVLTLASFVLAEGQPKALDSEKASVKSEVIGTDVAVAAGDHALVNKDEVVLMQGQKRVVIAMKTITSVSSTAVNILSINVGASTLAEAPSTPLLVKSKDHYVGIVWTDKSRTGAVVVKISAGEYWPFVAALEAAGIKVVNADTLSVAR